MIKAFADLPTAALFADVPFGDVSPEVWWRARLLLMVLHAAENVGDLRAAPGNRFGVPAVSERRGETLGYAGEGEAVMLIRLEEVEAGAVDFSALAPADDALVRRAGPIHPGFVLRQQFLDPLNLSLYGLAKAIRVPRSRLSDVVLGRRAVTPETALRLARYFGTSAEFWLTLQARHDLELARASLAETLARDITPMSGG